MRRSPATDTRGTAREQVRAARKRAAQRRAAAQNAMRARRRNLGGSGGSLGVGIAVVATLGVLFGGPAIIAAIAHVDVKTQVSQGVQAEAFSRELAAGFAKAFAGDDPGAVSARAVAPVPTPPESFEKPLGTMLVVNALGRPIDEATRTKLSSLVDDAYAHRLHTAGLLDPTYYPEPARGLIDVGREINLIAEAQYRQSGRSLFEEATRDDLAEWIEQAEGVDALLWLYDEDPGSRFDLDSVHVVSIHARGSASLRLRDVDADDLRHLAEEIRLAQGSFDEARASSPHTPAPPSAPSRPLAPPAKRSAIH